MIERHPESPVSYDLVIVGGGASGLVAAIEAARTLHQAQVKHPGLRSAKILILEKHEKIGRKVLATGNGRCNLTNRMAAPESYHGRDPRFARGALFRYGVPATLEFFLDLGLPCREEGEGRIYPVCQQAAAVLDILIREVELLGVEIKTSATVSQMEQIQPLLIGEKPLSQQPHWLVKTSDGLELQTTHVILATGGQASPNLGSDGSGYTLAGHVGHHLVKPRPALVQIETGGRNTEAMSGVRVEAGIKLRKILREIATESGEILFTDYGLSGIPILQLSRLIGEILSQGQANLEICLDLLPELSETDIAGIIEHRCSRNPDLSLNDLLTGLVHKKISHQITREVTGLAPGTRVKHLGQTQIRALARTIKQYVLPVTGTRDFSQAQVTAGGLDCSEFFPDRLESRLCPGLFACGELLDIDGDCGGFNLQWAWSSGRLAGYQAACQILEAKA